MVRVGFLHSTIIRSIFSSTEENIGSYVYKKLLQINKGLFKHNAHLQKQILNMM